MSETQNIENELSSHISHTRQESKDRAIINNSTLSNTLKSLEPMHNSTLSVENLLNVNSTGTLCTEDLKGLGEKLDYYKSAIETEESNLKLLEEKVQKK